jgi:hypothetical protein
MSFSGCDRVLSVPVALKASIKIDDEKLELNQSCLKVLVSWSRFKVKAGFWR